MTRDRSEPPLLIVPLLRGGTCEIWPDGIMVGNKPYALADLASGRLVGDPSIVVPPDTPAWPAVELTLQDARLILLTPSDPLDAWQALEALFRVAPLLRTPLPPMPGRTQWRGGTSSVPGAGTLPPGIFGALESVESGSSEAVLAGIAHLSLFFAPILLPLVIWLASRERWHYAARQAKQALVFQTFYALATLMLVILWFVVAVGLAASTQGNSTAAGPVGILVTVSIFFVLAVALAIFALLFSVYAAVQTFRGRPFSYPLLRRI